MTDRTIVTIGEISTRMESGFACSKSRLVQNGIPHLRPFNIGRDGRLNLNEVFEIPPDAVPNGKGRLSAGDVLFNNTNSDELVGKSALIQSDMIAGFSNHMTRIVIDPRRAEPAFVAYSLDRLWAHGHFRRICTRWVSQSAVNTKALADVEIALPPLPEQRRIVGILDRAASIRALRRQAQDTARLIIPALFNKMFGDPATNAKGWPLLSLESILAKTDYPIRTGPFGSQLRHSEFVDSGIPVLGIDNIATNKFIWTASRCLSKEKFQNFLRFQVKPRDLIITIMGTTGRCAIAPDDLPICMSTKHLCVLSLDSTLVEPKFVWAALLFDPFVRSQVDRTGHGAVMEGWNMGLVKRLRLRVPPLSQQRQFVNLCNRLEVLTERQNAAVTGAAQTATALSATLLR